MTKDPKTQPNQPTEIADAVLEDANGGYYQYKLNNVLVTSYGAAGGTVDISAAEEELMVLRRRPTRIEKDLTGDIEKAGVLRRRPTR